MGFLDVALAFSLTMLIVATIVTQLVDLLKNTPKRCKNRLSRQVFVEFSLDDLVSVGDQRQAALRSDQATGSS